MNSEERIKKELNTIDCLLQNKKFAEEMAIELETAYYKGNEEKAPPFLETGDSTTIDRSLKDEKIAMNMAGFYALECGLNYLCSLDHTTSLQWIERITTNQADDTTSILNRFANATWKAGQPYRGLERIRRSNFISFSSLSYKEIQKDHRQIIAAANKLRSVLKSTDKEVQFIQLRDLLQNKDFAYEMAIHSDCNYYIGENKLTPSFLTKDEMNASIKKPLKEEKIAINIAGFYALECATN